VADGQNADERPADREKLLEAFAPPHRATAPAGSLDQYLREISAYPLIDRDEGDRVALEKLVNSNLRFVVSIAKKYQNQGVALADLINEGNLGLIRAAEKFDETRGVKFISYAVWWIRQAILQALAEQSRIVRVPLNRAGELHRIGKRSSALVQELGREPTVGELAEGLEVNAEELYKTMSIAMAHLSLDAPLVPGEDNKLLDYLPDEKTGPEQEAFEKALKNNVEAALSSLKPREAKILRIYYGLACATSPGPGRWRVSWAAETGRVRVGRPYPYSCSTLLFLDIPRTPGYPSPLSQNDLILLAAGSVAGESHSVTTRCRSY
jgi:RNA polymerase primary sigma factor